MTAVIELAGIGFRRGDSEILSDISWRIEPGQHWGLLGANGSGKTTLLKIVTGYEWATTGTVEVLGQRFGECLLQELLRTIGWVSASLAAQIAGHMRAINIVVAGIDAALDLYREYTTQEYQRAHDALARVGGLAFVEQRYETLSQGQQQRVLIARALINRPRLLVLDEPCVGLDPAAREAFLADLTRLAARSDSPGIIYVTHHIEELLDWIDHVLVLRDGCVLAAGATGEVITDGVLTDAFGSLCRVQRDNGRYRLQISADD